MKLISMTDFALYYAGNMTYKDHSEKCTKYAKFLKQPLTLGMFIPCDEDGNHLEEPLHYRFFIDYENDLVDDLPVKALDKFYEYDQAKKKVLFEGFELEEVADGGISIVLYNSYFFGAYDLSKSTFVGRRTNIIEGLIKNDLTLTPNAIEQLGL